ncbi:MAG: hypothetical protein K6G22_01910 [Lachnospiraceae bacterium]|nr:hypothetical protein [Lachnospiraceae bacterium]
MENIAIISPLESIDKEEVLSDIYFLTGDNAKTSVQAAVSADNYKFFFHGAAIKAVDCEDGKVLKVRDIQSDDIPQFNLELAYALTYNPLTTESLATNGNVYVLSESSFNEKYPEVVKNTVDAMNGIRFAFMYFTINGEVVYAELIDDPKEDSVADKYSMSLGYVADKREILKSMLPKTVAELADANRKLNQEEIDLLVRSLLKGVK